VRARRWRVKLVGGVPGVLLALLPGAGFLLAMVGYSQLNALRPNPAPQLTAAKTPQLVAYLRAQPARRRRHNPLA
jgi:hypothetical protein